MTFLPTQSKYCKFISIPSICVNANILATSLFKCLLIASLSNIIIESNISLLIPSLTVEISFFLNILCLYWHFIWSPLFQLYKKYCTLSLVGVFMSYSSYTVAKTVCSLSRGKVTNIQLQKLLYLMHMYYLGQTGKPLVDETFEAWEYGPVLPSVYDRVFVFGADPIEYDMFYKHEVIPKEDKKAYEIINYFLSKLLCKKPSYLVALTHHKGGAWKKFYRKKVKNIKLPNKDIKIEYENIVRNGYIT